MESIDKRYQLVKLIVSRWDNYKLIANSLGYLPKDEWRSVAERNSDPLIEAEHRLFEDKHQLNAWINNPPTLECILPKLYASNKAYLRCISSFCW